MQQVYNVAAFFVYTLFLITLIDSVPAPTSAHLASWVMALVMEFILLGSSLAVATGKHREPNTVPGNEGKLRHHMSRWEVADTIIDCTRILFLTALVTFYLAFVLTRKKKQSPDATVANPDEATGLLTANENGNGSAAPQANGYGSAPTGGRHQHTEGEPAGWERPKNIPSRSWWDYLRGYSVLLPYLWPSKDLKLKIVFVICIILVFAQRVINIAVVAQVGLITNILSGENGPVRMPWLEICAYIIFRLLQGQNGFLGASRSMLWIPIGQYSYRELSVAAFEHVHSLSLDFHLGKKTGEVISALSKGNSINTFLEQVTFSVVPMIVDLLVAIGYFLYIFDAYYALVVAIVTFWYVYLTIRMAQWRADIRRDMVNADRDEGAVK